MMRYFYGVHLQSSRLSAAFDVVRYISEPDSVRFSHITLRGPYSRPLTSSIVKDLNESCPREWSVRLDGVGGFINGSQNTVMIKIDLLDLADLFYKPDFADGVPHLTIYDGSDRVYAAHLTQLLFRFDFHEVVRVGLLRRLSPKASLSGSFAILFNDFSRTFFDFFGCEPSAEFIRSLDQSERLQRIEAILKTNFVELYDKLNTRPIFDAQLRFPFED